MTDLNEDGNPDVLLGGNFYECNIEMGRYDASYGHVLSFTENGTMEVNPLGKLKIEGQVRRILPIKIKGRDAYVLVKNDDAVQLVQLGAVLN